MAIEHRTVETNGVRLHCAVDGEGPLVLFLHGFPECWWSWRHQLAALAPRFRVVAPDLRGYNESERPEGVDPYRPEALVADVLGLIHAFGEREAVLVAHDWGGAIAWLFAMQHPEATRRLVVMNCPHPARMNEELRANPRQMLRSWYMLFFQIPWLPETLLSLNHGWAVGNAVRNSAIRRDRITDEDVAVLREAASRPGAMRAAVNYYRAMFRSRLAADGMPPALRRFLYGSAATPAAPADVPRITAPTLLLWGEEDVALEKRLTDHMEPLFAGPFTRQFVPQSGHWVQQEQPDVVNAALLAFLDDLAPAATDAAAQPTAP